MKKLARLVVVSVMVLCCWQVAGAQNSRTERKAKKEAEVKKMVDSSDYRFEANFAIPQGGGDHALTSLYDLKVKKDSIIAFLPYFGVSHMAPPMGSDDGGIKFATTKFSYKQREKKKGGWEITIKPTENNITDWRDVQQMILTISPAGYASLTVISSNRDPISFSGELASKN